ncbi:MAG: isochorismatase family protein [Anaerolineales bacterium]|nr:isochorismatase family protein [Anaerolineales bacterium]
MSKKNQPLDIDHTALLVIDVQQALFERSTPIYKAEQMVSNINSLIAHFRKNSSPVVFIQHENNKVVLKGTPGWQIHAGLAREESDPVVQKQHGNAFEKTELHELLETHGVNTIVVTGLVSNGCVKASCLGGLELGYRVILAADGHSSWHKDTAKIIKTINQEMEEAGVEVIQAEEIVSA